MKAKKIYLSGKITGLPINEVIAKFRAAEKKLQQLGYEPVSPLNNGLPFESEWAEHVGKDISLLLRSDAVYLLPDYNDSRGSQIELCVALQQKMTIYADDSIDEMQLPFTPRRLETHEQEEA